MPIIRIIAISAISLSFHALGCGAIISDNNSSPEIFLAEGDRDSFHLEWTHPLKKPRLVFFRITSFSYVPELNVNLWIHHGKPIDDAERYLGDNAQMHDYLLLFLEGSLRSHSISYQAHRDHSAVIVQILTVEQAIPLFTNRHSQWEAYATRFSGDRNAWLVYPPPDYAVGSPSTLTFPTENTQ